MSSSTDSSSQGLNLFDLKSGKIKTLHITWVAFFISFFVWFNHAPLLVFMKESLDLTNAQLKSLMILNVALTIPARIVIGMLVDRFGPRKVYSSLLVISSFIVFGFATADTYERLALFRFLLGFVGAGFVIGIRMVGEWFPAKQVGVAEGIYGGWGNFGSAAAAMTLPTIAALFGGEDGWRYALGMTGVIAFFYGIFYFFTAKDTPEGATYFKPNRVGGLEVTSKKDFYFYLAMNIPLYVALAILTWRLSPAQTALLSETACYGIYTVLIVLFVYQVSQIYAVNKENLSKPVDPIHQYKFKQVAIMDFAYFVTFGSELAVVSMLPLFFMETFSLTPVQAGLTASGFAFMNLVARPTGGFVSDKFGRKRTMTILVTGLMLGYLLMSQINSGWWLPAAIVASMMCSFFVQSGEGAVFAMVPLIKRRMTGQIAGMVGAYGNVGAGTFLLCLSFFDSTSFFLFIAACAALCLIAIQFLDEPEGHIAEIHEDGTVEMIEVS